MHNAFVARDDYYFFPSDESASKVKKAPQAETSGPQTVDTYL